jgi:hypothetical protein
MIWLRRGTTNDPNVDKVNNTHNVWTENGADEPQKTHASRLYPRTSPLCSEPVGVFDPSLRTHPRCLSNPMVKLRNSHNQLLLSNHDPTRGTHSHAM